MIAHWVVSDHAKGIEDDNKGVIVITLDKIRMTILITDEGDIIKQKIFNTTCLLSEGDIQRLYKKNTISKEHNGILYNQYIRLYVPESNLLQMEVIQKHHDTPIAGHPGYEKTGREFGDNSKVFAEIFQHLRGKLGSTIRNNSVRKAMIFPYME